MPFKLRILRKTRHYNVLSRNVLVVSVELIDRTTLECTLSADSSGFDCLHNVCQRLGLQQAEFFGLRYMSKRPYPKVRWVELDRPLKKQLDKYAQSPALFLAVQYYIHDVGLLQDDVTRSHYFLQVKQDVLEGRLRCNYEQAVLLASYSLQAEFGDHQPERHTPEYLKDFRLFPKQAVNESEVGSLLEAVVWQYSSLASLGQPLAETYYILEAQHLLGYGQETFIARDEKGSEVYLGASLLGIVVEPASGAMQTFYRWNDITNLINHKRNFGIECSRSDETVHFTFEEPDAAKYVWKMCVKQHTFYKGNQDVLEVTSGGIETRSLAIPDLQSSVMSSYKMPHHMNQPPNTHEMVKSPQLIGDTMYEDLSSRTFASSLPHLDLSCVPKSSDVTTQGPIMDSSVQLTNHDSFNLMTQPGLSMNASRFSMKQTPSIGHQPQSRYEQPKHDVSNHHYIYPSEVASSTAKLRERRTLLPQYRPAPDYETALLQKYGPGVNSRLHTTVLYSSQPEISTLNNDKAIADKEREGNAGLEPANYNQYKAYTDISSFGADQQTPHQPKLNHHVIMPGTLHNTYSTPELAAQSSTEGGPAIKRGSENEHLDYHFIHGYKPPPPYPYSKPSSNSTPDLASVSKNEEAGSDSSGRKRLSLLTASLGCLGSPELSRTYENLSELTEAVESLRQELTKGSETSFLHSFAPNLSTDDLDAIYQLSSGHVAVEKSYNLKKTSPAVAFNGLKANTPAPPAHATPAEPIYQNVGALLSDVNAEKRGRAKSAPELDLDAPVVGLEAQRASSHPNRVLDHTAHTAVSFLSPYDKFQQQPQPQTQIQPQTHLQQQTQVQQQAQLQPHQFQLTQLHHSQSQQQLQQPTAQPLSTQQQQQLLNQLPSQQQQAASQSQQQQQQAAQSQQQQVAQSQQQKPMPPTYNNNSQNRGNNMHVTQTTQKEVPSLIRKGQMQQQQQFHSTEDPQSNPSSKLRSTTGGTPQKDMKTKPDLLLDSPSLPASNDPKAMELHQKMNSMDIVREFEAIPRLKKKPDFASALRSENLPRNRYKDIIPYEENRVKITPSKDNKAGYINASHITASVGGTQRFYICAQGPLVNTVAHFWQSVWEMDVRLVVMLAAVEGDTNTSKSFPYWPQSDNTSVECDQFRIYRKQSTKTGFHVTSRLQLVHMTQKKSRAVWHLQFTDWADHGCPEDTQSFLSFLEELSTLRRITFNEVEGVGRNRNTPVLVHCSAGVGRSGVTIMCDLLMEASRHNVPLEPPKLLAQLRQQRMALVQSFNQYKFVYKVLLASLQNTRLI